MREIAQAIQDGARAYLNRQFRTLALFVVVVFALLFLLPGDGGIKVGRAIAFIFGPASPPPSATSACGWPCAPTCGWRPPRSTPTDARRGRASPSAPAAWWACPSSG